MSIELRRVGVVGGQVQPVSGERLFCLESGGLHGRGPDPAGVALRGRSLAGALRLVLRTWPVANHFRQLRQRPEVGVAHLPPPASLAGVRHRVPDSFKQHASLPPLSRYLRRRLRL
jgi:hypothetical protein